MKNVNIKSAISEQHVTASNTETITQLVAKYYNQEDNYDLIELSKAFNIAMFDLEEKKFKDYVEYVSDLTNGFESTNHIAYNYTKEIEIKNAWIDCVNKYYPTENLKLESIKEFVYGFPSVVSEGYIIDDWLDYFAADMRVEIETVTSEFGTTSVYVVGYSK